MTTPQEAPKRDTFRPLFVLVLFAAALCAVVMAVVDSDWDQLVIAILFVTVAMQLRTIGVYRRRLGLEL